MDTKSFRLATLFCVAFLLFVGCKGKTDKVDSAKSNMPAELKKALSDGRAALKSKNYDTVVTSIFTLQDGVFTTPEQQKGAVTTAAKELEDALIAEADKNKAAEEAMIKMIKSARR